MSDGLDILPPPRREIVRAAIVAAFGSAPIGAVRLLHGGATGAAPLCVEVGRRRYLVRAEGEASPLRNPHQYQSMRIAADAGIAPRVHYIDETARVAVTDFIEQQPLHTYPGGPRSLAQALGELLHRLQDTPVFPAFVDYPVIVGRLFAHVRRTGLFAEGLLDPHTERLARVSAAYDAGVTQLVSSHNDFIPANILFDGARLWVIDWESAYRNDPLVDVATALDTQARSPELEEVLLRAWLGRSPDEGVHARLDLARALARLYYAGVFLSASAAAWGARGDSDLSAATLAELRQAMAAGRLVRGAPATKHVLGKMYLASFLAGGLPPGFDLAV